VEEVRALLDTNILVDYLKGIPQARREVKLYTTVLISVITRIEILAGVHDREEELQVKAFLNRFELVRLDDAIADVTATIRRETRLRLPDAVILATARSQNALLVTRDATDFPADDPGVRIPYSLR
jgi:predicted nucleic acid-binding protein